MKLSKQRMILAVFVVFAAASGVVADTPRRDADAKRGGAVVRDASSIAGANGRYKKQGRLCVWDANDSGPNQCTPVTEGRFKKDGAACVWDAAGRGPNQCTPSKGRFKKDGDKCVWTPTDSGPNQCSPRQAR